ncbi:MAG: S8 family serine peptidase [Acidobacteriota bacterium]
MRFSFAPPARRRLLAALLLAPLFPASPAPAMDQVRALEGVDTAVSQFGVTGRNVVVALLDRGIDWKNADFRNADGTTRIAYIFDLTDDTGAHAAGNTYGMGTLYTRAQIDAALAGGPQLAVRDAVGHGTTTAGIATGNGRNLPSGKYRGIATEATIIAVKITSEGAAAHGSEAAEAPFYQPARIPVAIDFVRDKAHELGQPAVMLLNFGSIGGPADGTSDLARKVDATVGPGIPGLVIVNGAGDDGGVPNRAGGTVPQGGSIPIQIQKGNATTPLVFEAWYPSTDRFNVTIQGPSGTFGPYTSPATNSVLDTHTTADFVYDHRGSVVTAYGSQTGREIYILFTGPAATYTVTLTGATVTNGRFHAILNPSNILPAYSTNRFLTNVEAGSLWHLASAHNNICPNAYVNKTTWTDLNGTVQHLTGEGNPGEIWKGSSVGPTFDGRLGIDVSAPGTDLFTTYNPTSVFGTNRGNMVQDGNGFYGAAGAVSAAAPSVTGIIALMLQANPSLDAAQVKQFLQQSAKGDSFTGAVPNTTWGYGKIDAVGAVSRAVKTTCAASSTSLCLTGGRFRVKVNWSVPSQHTSGSGKAVALTGDTGYFWFFSSNNVELVIKVVDGRPVNQRFWVFYGALSDVQYTIMVEDTQTGVVKSYSNPSGHLASVADTSAFSDTPTSAEEQSASESGDAAAAAAAWNDDAGRAIEQARADRAEALAAESATPLSSSATCTANATTLCLNGGRFKVQVAWQVPSQSRSGVGTAVPLTGDTGHFWFFSSNNVELVIKAVDGRALNNKFWVFYGALSDVQYTITVTDTTTGAVKTYSNPSGTLASVADTSAF